MRILASLLVALPFAAHAQPAFHAPRVVLTPQLGDECARMERDPAAFERQLAQAASLVAPFRTFTADYRAPDSWPHDWNDAVPFFRCALPFDRARTEPVLEAARDEGALDSVYARMLVPPAETRAYLLDRLAHHASGEPTSVSAAVIAAALGHLDPPLPPAPLAALVIRWLDWIAGHGWLADPTHRACVEDWINAGERCNRPGDGWPNRPGNPGCDECQTARDAMTAVRRGFSLVELSASDPRVLARLEEAVRAHAAPTEPSCPSGDDVDRAREAVIRSQLELSVGTRRRVIAPGASCVAVDTLEGTIRAQPGPPQRGDIVIEGPNDGPRLALHRGDREWDDAPQLMFSVMNYAPPLGSSSERVIVARVRGVWRVVHRELAWIS